MASRSSKVCLTCHFFRHHAGVNGIPLLTSQLHQGLLAHGEHLTAAARAGLTTWRGSGVGARACVTAAANQRPPLTPKEGWLSDGRQVLRFRPTRWKRQVQRLEITSGELLPGEQVPLLKNRREISRDKALKFWDDKRKAGWKPCSPQW